MILQNVALNKTICWNERNLYFIFICLSCEYYDKTLIVEPHYLSLKYRYQTMRSNLRALPGLKWQYIALEQNYVINYPAAKICWPDYEPRLR